MVRDSSRYTYLSRRRSSAALSLASVLAAIAPLSVAQAAHIPYPPVNDTAELRRTVTNALNALEPTLLTLDTLGQLKGPCPPHLRDQLDADIQHLQVDSQEFRAHAQAMQVRGPAYLEEWQEHLTGATDPDLRQLAGERHLELQSNFATIKEGSQQTSEGLKTFLSDVTPLRRALENESATGLSTSTKDLVRKASQDGQQVKRKFERLKRELDLAAANLKKE